MYSTWKRFDREYIKTAQRALEARKTSKLHWSVCVQEDPTFDNNWEKVRKRVDQSKMYDMASKVPYMKVQMDNESPFDCKYFCEKCNKTLTYQTPSAFNTHIQQVHMTDSNGIDAMEFGNDVCTLFMGRMLFFCFNQRLKYRYTSLLTKSARNKNSISSIPHNLSNLLHFAPSISLQLC